MTRSVFSCHTGSKTMYGKKALSVLLAVIMLIGCFGSGLTVFAADEIASGTCNNSISWNINNEGLLTVSGSGTIPNYTERHGKASALAPWYSYRNQITGIKIEEGITEIGSYAFHGFLNYDHKITSLQLPESLVSIKAMAFNETYFDCDLIIPSNVESVGSGAFSGSSVEHGTFENHTLTFLTDKLTKIEDSVFMFSQMTGTLTLPSDITEIGDFAFSAGFTGKLVLPENVTTIGSYAFSGGRFSEIQFNEGLKTIKDNAFRGNVKLREIHFPDSLEYIGDYAFTECETGDCNDTNGGVTGDLVIPANVTYIGEKAFYNDYWFNGKLTILNPSASIGTCAFHGCAAWSGKIQEFFADYPQYITITDGGMVNDKPIYYCYCAECNEQLCCLTAIVLPMLLPKGNVSEVNANFNNFPVSASSKTVSVKNTSIANVSENGKVEGVDVGTTEIQVNMLGVTDSAELTVCDAVVDIGEPVVGQPLDVNIACYPNGVEVQSVSYSSSDTSVLRVQSGVPVVKKSGNATLTTTINVEKDGMTAQITNTRDITATNNVSAVSLTTSDKFDLYTNDTDTAVVFCESGTTTPAVFTESPFIEEYTYDILYDMIHNKWTTVQGDPNGTVVNGITFYGPYLTISNSLFCGFDGTNVIVPTTTNMGGNANVANDVKVANNVIASGETINLEINESKEFGLFIIPDGAEYQNDSFSVTNDTIATYDSATNTVTGLTSGQTQLVFSFEDTDGTDHECSWNIKVSSNSYATEIPDRLITYGQNTSIYQKQTASASVVALDSNDTELLYSKYTAEVVSCPENAIYTTSWNENTFSVTPLTVGEYTFKLYPENYSTQALTFKVTVKAASPTQVSISNLLIDGWAVEDIDHDVLRYLDKEDGDPITSEMLDLTLGKKYNFPQMLPDAFTWEVSDKTDLVNTAAKSQYDKFVGFDSELPVIVFSGVINNESNIHMMACGFINNELVTVGADWVYTNDPATIIINKTLNDETIEIKENETLEFNCVKMHCDYLYNYIDNNVSFSIADPTIATISYNNGILNMVGMKGENIEHDDGFVGSETTLTITYNDIDAAGNELQSTKTWPVRVPYQPNVLVESISVNDDTVELDIGSTNQIVATVQPSNATNQELTYSSENSDIAAVDENGVITGIAEGTANITITANDGSGVSTTVTVTVTDPSIIARGQCGVDVFWKITQDGDDKVFTVYPGTNPTKNKKMWHRTGWKGDVFDAWDITKIVIEEGVASIGSYAFGSNSYSANGPTDQITSFGGNESSSTNATTTKPKNFKNATGNLNLPSTLLIIDTCAFYACEGLTGSLVIPDSVTSIGHYAFCNCKGFNGTLTLPDSLTSIGSTAFSGCSRLEGDLVIPNATTKIDSYAFSDCTGLDGKLTIGNNVQTIGMYAFSNCSKLTGDIDIPDSVTTIGNNAFSNCSCFDETLTIGNSVQTIGNKAFFGCKNLIGDIDIPDSVTSIGNSAFYDCQKFDGTLTIGSNVQSIGSDAFHYCYKLTGTLNIPDSVTSIGSDAFHDTASSPNNSFTYYGKLEDCNVYKFFENYRNPDDNYQFIEVIEDTRTEPSDVNHPGNQVYKIYCVDDKHKDGASGIMRYIDDGASKNLVTTVNESIPYVSVSGITNVPNQINLVVGGSEQLNPTVAPENATKTAVTFATNNPDVVTVNETGLVTGISEGAAAITITAADGVTKTVEITVSPILATSVSAEPETVSITVGQTQQLAVTVLPENATNSAVTYTSSDETVATVDETGKITAVAPGTATITVTAADGSGKQDTVTVTVNPVLADSVSASPETIDILVGETEKISVDVQPANTTDKKVTYESQNPSVATVDNEGNVTAVAPGTTVIVVTAADGSGKQDLVEVTVSPVLANSVTATPETVSVLVGETAQISADVQPANTTNKDVTYSSSDEGVATVDVNGKITAVNSGTATITVTAADGSGKQDTVTVTVNPVLATSISLNLDNLVIPTNGTYQLQPVVEPDNTTNKTVNYYVAGASGVVSVDYDTGLVTAIAPGTSNITAFIVDGPLVTIPVTVYDIVVPDSIAVAKDQTDASVSPSVNPSNAGITPTYTYTSTNTDIVTVDSTTGNITPVATGEAIIIVSDGTITKEIPVTIVDAEAEYDKNHVTQTSPAALNVTIVPTGTDYSISAVSNNPAVVAVDANGTVTATGNGNATVTVTITANVDGNPVVITKTFAFTAKIVPTDIDVNVNDPLIIAKGEEVVIGVTVTPDDAKDKDVDFSSLDSTVASVDETGKVTAKDTGVTVITVQTPDGSVSETIEVIVADAAASYDKTELNEGETATLTVEAIPSDALSVKKIETESFDPTVATVDVDGNVTGIKGGVTVIKLNITLEDDNGTEVVIEKAIEITVDHVPAESVQEPTHDNSGDGTYEFDLVTYCENDNEEIDRDTVTLEKHDRVEPTVNTPGNVEYYKDINSDDTYIWDPEKGDEGEYVKKDDVTVPAIVPEHVDRVEPTDDADGNIEHYHVGDDKYIKDNDGKFVPVDNVTLHNRERYEQQNIHHDEAGEPDRFDLVTLCTHDNYEFGRTTVTLEKHDRVEPTVNTPGNVEYYKDINSDDTYIWDPEKGDDGEYVKKDDVTVPKVTVEPVSGYPATETEHGQKDHFKDNYGNLYVLDGGNYIPVTESDLIIHNITEIKKDEVAVGCVVDGGYDVYNHCTCNDCDDADEFVKHVTINAPGHLYDAGSVTKEPTCKDSGVMTKTCTVCGETLETPISALGHKDADRDSYCDRCHDQIGFRCSKCDWYDENKDKPGAFGVVVKIIHVIVHFVESINRLT